MPRLLANQCAASRWRLVEAMIVSRLRSRVGHVEERLRDRALALMRRPDFPQGITTVELTSVLLITAADLQRDGLVVGSATRGVWDRYLASASPTARAVGIGWLKAAREVRLRWSEEGYQAQSGTRLNRLGVPYPD